MSDVPDPSAGAGGQRELLARLRAVIEAKDAENAVLRAELDAALERYRRLELRVAELERRLGQDSTDSGTPTSKESIGARERRRAGRRRQESERERRKDRKRGGQPGHQGKGLAREPDPDEVKEAGPPAECRSCTAALDGAAAAGSRWAQVIDVEVIRKVTEWLLPGRECPCCGAVTFAEPPPGAHAGSVSYGAVLNAAAVVLTAYGNVPPERAAQVMAMLLGVPVSPGWVDKASARLAAQLGKAGFDAAMLAALAGEDALAADETPVNVLDKNAPQPAAREEGEEQDPEETEKAAAGAPHVLIVRTPDGRLRCDHDTYIWSVDGDYAYPTNQLEMLCRCRRPENGAYSLAMAEYFSRTAASTSCLERQKYRCSRVSAPSFIPQIASATIFWIM